MLSQLASCLMQDGVQLPQYIADHMKTASGRRAANQSDGGKRLWEVAAESVRAYKARAEGDGGRR